MKFNVPTKLCFLRIIFAIVIIILLLFPFYRFDIAFPQILYKNILIDLRYIIAGIIFIFASITDYFDGYLARAFKVQSNFGKCLDPIADKLLVSVSLIMLSYFSNQNILILIPSIIIICREIMVSGLREFLATINVGVPVTRLAKWKTAIQMMAITALLLASNGSEYVYNEIMDIVEAEEFIRISFEGVIQTLGEIFLCISAVLTVITGYIYFKVGFKNF